MSGPLQHEKAMARVVSAKDSCCRSGSDAQVNDVLSFPRLMRTPHVGKTEQYVQQLSPVDSSHWAAK